MKARLAVLIFAFILFFIFQIAESGVSGFIENIPNYGYLLSLVGIVLGIQQLWQLIFCQGRPFGHGRKFELTGFAEGILYAFNCGLIGILGYSLWVSQLAWYEYFIPVLICLQPLASSINYYFNRNDSIILFPGELEYCNNTENGKFKFVNYKFYRAESNALSSSFMKTSSWHVSFKNEKGKAIHFDLKDMNLAGHKNSMEKYLKFNGPANHL